MGQQAVAKDDVAQGVIVAEKDHPGLRRMVQILAIESTQQEEAGKDFVLDILENILSAESVDDIFAAQDKGTMSGKDFTNRPFFVKTEDITWMKSTRENGLPFFAMMNVTEIATGEQIPVSCGGQTFVAVLFKLQQSGYFDVSEEFPMGRSVVLTATETPNGAYLSLKPYKVATAASRGKK